MRFAFPKQVVSENLEEFVVLAHASDVRATTLLYVSQRRDFLDGTDQRSFPLTSEMGQHTTHAGIFSIAPKSWAIDESMAGKRFVH